MNTQTPFYILSGALSHLDYCHNAERCKMLARSLRQRGHPTAPVNGCYKGKPEPAVLVVNDRPYNGLCEAEVIEFARLYDQESILAVDANGCARLIYCDDKRFEPLGRWKGTSEKIAKERDAYTERAGRFYIVE